MLIFLHLSPVISQVILRETLIEFAIASNLKNHKFDIMNIIVLQFNFNNSKVIQVLCLLAI